MGDRTHSMRGQKPGKACRLSEQFYKTISQETKIRLRFDVAE